MQMDEGKGKKEGSPISIAEVHILKLNLALLKVKGPCSRKVLHLAECSQCIKNSPDTRNNQLSPSPLSSLTSVSSFSRSNMFSMSMKLVWIILQEG